MPPRPPRQDPLPPLRRHAPPHHYHLRLRHPLRLLPPPPRLASLAPSTAARLLLLADARPVIFGMETKDGPSGRDTRASMLESLLRKSGFSCKRNGRETEIVQHGSMFHFKKGAELACWWGYKPQHPEPLTISPHPSLSLSLNPPDSANNTTASFCRGEFCRRSCRQRRRGNAPPWRGCQRRRRGGEVGRVAGVPGVGGGG